jgi:hypothetical protein
VVHGLVGDDFLYSDPLDGNLLVDATHEATATAVTEPVLDEACLTRAIVLASSPRVGRTPFNAS